jgi:capsular polysaccharide transport system permease protein
MMLLVRGLEIQFDVIYALILRESRTRFGKHLLGYVWALVEPLLWIGLLFGLFYFSGRQIPYGMTVITFVTTGVVPFILVRNCVRYGINAVSANRSLLFFPQVHALDVVMSRAFLEMATIILVFWAIIGTHELYYGHYSPTDTAMVIGGLFLGGLIGASAALAFCFANMFLGWIDRVINRLLRILFFTSGAFFDVNEVPLEAQRILLWNPLLHITSIVRIGWNAQFDNPNVTATYPLTWAAGFALLGLFLMPLAARRGYRGSGR